MSARRGKQRLRNRIAAWLDRIGCGFELAGCFAPSLLILGAGLLWLAG